MTNLIQLKFLLIISYVDGDCHLDDVCQYEIYNSAEGRKILNFVKHSLNYVLINYFSVDYLWFLNDFI